MDAQRSQVAFKSALSLSNTLCASNVILVNTYQIQLMAFAYAKLGLSQELFAHLYQGVSQLSETAVDNFA